MLQSSPNQRLCIQEKILSGRFSSERNRAIQTFVFVESAEYREGGTQEEREPERRSTSASEPKEAPASAAAGSRDVGGPPRSGRRHPQIALLLNQK